MLATRLSYRPEARTWEFKAVFPRSTLTRFRNLIALRVLPPRPAFSGATPSGPRSRCPAALRSRRLCVPLLRCAGPLSHQSGIGERGRHTEAAGEAARKRRCGEAQDRDENTGPALDGTPMRLSVSAGTACRAVPAGGSSEPGRQPAIPVGDADPSHPPQMENVDVHREIALGVGVVVAVLAPGCGGGPTSVFRTMGVSPSTNLVNGSEIEVSVRGFGHGVKFFISECADASDAIASRTGCGPYWAAQPFGLTNSAGQGSRMFRVSSTAATKVNSPPAQPCSDQCVVVAVNDVSGGGFVYAPITFAQVAQVKGCRSSQLSASASQGSGAGGHEAVVVVLTNTSSTECTLSGYPTTAWFLGVDDSRLSATVTQEAAPTPVTVTLMPGEQASTTAWTDNPGVPSPSYCHPVTGSAVVVEVTSDATPLTATLDMTVCSTENDIGITPITAGMAESPM